MKHVALILARSGSQSIPSKNLLALNGLPLIGYPLKVLNQCEFLDEFWISTNSQDIADVSKRITPRVQVHFRSDYSASNNASSLESVQEFLKYKDADLIYLIQCTSPCLRKEFLSEAYKILAQGECDSVFSVTRTHRLRWARVESSELVPMNFDPRRRPRRQNWEGEMVESGHFYAATRRLILEESRLQSGHRSQVVEIPPALAMELDETWQIPHIELMLKLNYESI